MPDFKNTVGGRFLTMLEAQAPANFAMVMSTGIVSVALHLLDYPIGARLLFWLNAALCVGLQEGMPLMRLAAFCNSAGTLVITQRGAIGLALPTREQVEALAASEACRVTCLPLDSMP